MPYPFISYDRGSSFGRMVSALFEAAGESVMAVVEADSPQKASALVHAGAGITLVDEFAAHGPRNLSHLLACAPTLLTQRMRPPRKSTAAAGSLLRM